MNKLKKLISNTVFFITTSKQYMAGEKVTPLSWIRAYIRFMRLVRKDL